jgi:hypothetical protein
LRVERLVAEHGADTDFLIVLRALVGDCPNRDARECERCDPHCPDLPQVFGGLAQRSGQDRDP